jgi:replicative DNA helicase
MYLDSGEGFHVGARAARPITSPSLAFMADIAVSGSIEQDAANIIFLYRDEVYNPDSPDKGICEVQSDKQRQGEPGTISLGYTGSQTRFDDLSYPWRPRSTEAAPRGRGFGAMSYNTKKDTP